MGWLGWETLRLPAGAPAQALSSPCAGVWRAGRWCAVRYPCTPAGQITQAQADAHPVFAVVGMVGSIDNDMCGTDMTIGCDTALHRVMEALDSLASTAASHQRCFVVEVMGRNCGWLALWAALAAGADWLLIPEAPPEYDHWDERMCDKLARVRPHGRAAWMARHAWCACGLTAARRAWGVGGGWGGRAMPRACFLSSFFADQEYGQAAPAGGPGGRRRR